MKKFLFSFLVLFAIQAYAQLTLEAGDSFSSDIIFSNPPAPSGFHNPGWVCVSFIPATVQPGDAVLFEVFDHGVGDGLAWSQVYSNAENACGSPSPFGFWDQAGSFRVTMLSGSATIFRAEAFVSIGPFFCPCNAYHWSMGPGPRLKISRLANSQAQVSWSTNSAGFILQSSTTLGTNDWVAVADPISTVGERFVVTVAGDKGFFRLRKS